MEQTTQRNVAFDIARSVAIIFMVFSNMAPILAEPHPMWFRISGSFSAPMFMVLAGMMVALTAHRHNFWYFLLRGALIMLVGAIIDVAFWRIYPFMTVDVLYLIGLAMPVTYLLNKLSPLKVLTLAVIFFALTPILQKYFGYTYYPTEMDLKGVLTVELENQTSILHHWLIDGWFPLFPWMGFVFLGCAFSKLTAGNVTKNMFASFMAMVVLGAVVIHFYPGAMFNREGYSEIFFPATAGYIITAIGVVGCVLYIIERLSSLKIWAVITPMGQASLLIYIVHIYVLARLFIYAGFKFTELSLAKFSLVYFILLITLLALAHVNAFYKHRVARMPFLMRFLLGS